MPSLTPLTAGAESLTPLSEDAQTLSALAEDAQTLAALAEQFAVTTGYPGLYPSPATFPSLATFPSPGSIVTSPGPTLAGAAEGTLSLAPLQEV